MKMISAVGSRRTYTWKTQGSFIPRREARSGFTLIELLVVITIILILARILLPTIEMAYAKAAETKCASNMHQLGQAFILYGHDWGFYPYPAWYLRPKQQSDWVRLPNASGSPNMPLSCAPGTSALGKYANPSGKPCQDTIYWCPTETLPPAGASGIGVAYRMNVGVSLFDWVSFTGYKKPLEINGVPHPASTYLLFEENDAVVSATANNDGAFGCRNAAGFQVISGPGVLGTSFAPSHHRGGTNALFCDGHVKWALTGPTNIGASRPGLRNYDVLLGLGCWPLGDNNSIATGDATAY